MTLSRLRATAPAGAALTLIAAATLALIAGPAPATPVQAAPAHATPGKAKAVRAKLTLEKLTTSGARGEISSKSSKCERGRKVTLRFVGQYGDVKLASDKTDRRGRWRVKVEITDRGIFYATAPKATNGKTKCAAAASKDRRLD